MQLDDLFEHSVKYMPVSQQQSAADTASGSGDSATQAAGQPEPWYRTLPTDGGVYLLTDEADRMVQLASAGDLRRALRARLAPGLTETPIQVEPKERTSVAAARRPDLAQIVRRIRWRPAHSMFEIAFDYLWLARVLMPESYLKHIAFGPAWFVHVDPSAEIPHFAAGKVLRSPPGTDLGPFATQTEATRFIQALEDIFDLCRYHHILEQAPNGQACAYFEMGRCPGPCNGSVPMAQYRAAISAALTFASGQRAGLQAQWETQMRAAAQAMAFEQANLLKQRLERARGLEHKAYRLARPVDQFCYLIVQRGGGRTRVKPFFVCAGRITPGEVTRLQEVGQVAARWMAIVQGASQDATIPREGREPSESPAIAGTDLPLRQELSEHIWLVSHYLFKAQTPGLFIYAADLPGPAELTEQIRARFGHHAEPEPAHAQTEPTGAEPDAADAEP